MKLLKNKIALFLLSGLLFTACDDFLDIQPTAAVIPENLDEYRALLTGAYLNFPNDRAMTGIRADEMIVNSSEYDLSKYGDIQTWNDRPILENAKSFSWISFYNTVFIANEVIKADNSITEGKKSDIDQLVGEAYMLRAYCYFLLVNYYGQPYTKSGAQETKGVPLQLDNDLEAVLTRSTVDAVYKSIVSDMEQAKKRMIVDVWETKYLYRFSRISVDAFMARLSLYMGRWKDGYEYAENVIKVKGQLEDLNVNPILPNSYLSKETIVALELTPERDVNNSVKLSKSLQSYYNKNDLRFNLYFKLSNGKYESIKSASNQFRSTFRVAEVYLTSAEAAAHNDNLTAARTRLLELMNKRYNTEGYQEKEAAVNSMNKEQLIQEILNERARELVFEGHRWFDLRRTTRPEIVKEIDGETFILQKDDPRYTMQIPKEAIDANPGLLN